MGQLIGILATLIILISFTMKDILKIRKINLIGSLLFVIYGIFIIQDIPTYVLNSGIAIVQIYNIIKHYKGKKINVESN